MSAAFSLWCCHLKNQTEPEIFPLLQEVKVNLAEICQSWNLVPWTCAYLRQLRQIRKFWSDSPKLCHDKTTVCFPSFLTFLLLFERNKNNEKEKASTTTNHWQFVLGMKFFFFTVGEGVLLWFYKSSTALAKMKPKPNHGDLENLTFLVFSLTRAAVW